ncbi:TRAP transporter large permease [Roseospirillum parvum]|uniref:TRAP transporter large permease protein n=1 Tax=Roseospirillum parvum TaxID=83401 RepID=A0A1G7ZBM4_9PROT|nr:TRAP transporter large permease [Roseospirillum parvum]SDH06015.1 TRAP transporter, DctM subunit [Roseospirillum parvum]
MSSPLIGGLCLAAMLVLIALGCPVALAMALTGVVGFGLVVAAGPAVAMLGATPFESLAEYGFSPIPMFILMGVFAAKARLSGELFEGARRLFGAWPGGVALAAVASCGAFSAISGSSLATAAGMGRVALPEMARHGYAPGLAAGTVAAGGTLGIMIPPSIALLLYALITEQSVGDMFIAGIGPGLLGLALYGAAIVLMVGRNPTLARPGTATGWAEKLAGLKGLLPLVVIFAVVLGGIYGGLFTPTEAAAVGAFGTLCVALLRGLGWAGFKDALREALSLSAMVFFMIVGAQILGRFLSVSRISNELVQLVAELGLGPYAVLAGVLLLFIVLGCVMDSMAMMLLTVPVVFPLIESAGFDPVWFGILTVVAVEMGLITPPVGMNVFVIKTLLPQARMGTLYLGVLPFVLADVVRLLVLIAFPGVALWLVG